MRCVSTSDADPAEFDEVAAAVQDGQPAFERVTLEMSLKPFRSVEPEAVRAVCRKVFRDFAALIRRSNATAVMLWTADGSEIRAHGRRDRMGQLPGRPYPAPKPPGEDPERRGAHARNWFYTDRPVRITYADLRAMVRSFNDIVRVMTGSLLRSAPRSTRAASSRLLRSSSTATAK